MDLNYVKIPISEPDICRCCISASGSCDMAITYESEAGIKEVYCDMLKEYLGISLKQWGTRQMICGFCIAQLRRVIAFKKQVLQAEKYLNLYYIQQTESPNVKSVKKENDITIYGIEEKYATVEQEAFKNPSTKGGRNKVPSLINEISISNRKQKKSTILKILKTESVLVNTEYDSDTPIAELVKVSSNNKGIEVEEYNVIPQIELKDIDSCRTKVDNNVQKSIRSKNPVKQISERKRLKLTCSTVLRDTTACPFRHHRSWFQCFYCFQDFMEIKPLRDHTLELHSDVDAELVKFKSYPRSLQIDISNLKCRRCALTLSDVNEMTSHFHAVHGKRIYGECIADYKVNSSPYTCHMCGREFHVFRTLTTHLNEHYANCICDVCGKSFLNTRRLEVHKRTHERGNYPCLKCGKVLKTKTSKANHMESVHSNRVIKCQICSKPMKHYNDRIKHMSEAHNITHNFKCPFCNRDYKIKHYLATHIRQTHGHKNKKCTECDMAFITNHGLKKHMLKHTGEKPYTCTVCCKSYARNYTLREHMRSHDVAILSQTE